MRTVTLTVVILAAAAWARGSGSAAGAPPPQTPGHHRLFFDTRLGGKPFRMAYALYLPKDYDTRPVPRPMVVFLNGAGECGANHEGLFVHGPAAEILRNKALAEGTDFLVLSPQCPGGMRWETPGLVGVVLEVVDHALRTWRVDADRVYLTGLSMGGQGTWRVAFEAQGRFAAIAPISAIAIEPARMAERVKGTTCWIISGGSDGGYTEGSRQMRKVLAAAGVDVVLTEIPGGDHGVWARFYGSFRFYEFLLLHRRGSPPPADRPTNEQLLTIAQTPPNSVDARLAEAFRRFRPWWEMINCGRDGDPGPRAEWSGRSNVFVTHPLDRSTPCRFMTTAQVPAEKKTSLSLVVGHHPEGDWDLVVRADGQEIFRQAVGPKTSKDGWCEVEVDLTRFAGRSVLLEVLNCASGWHHEAAYWARVEVK